MHKVGLALSGGGAKGAYQVGVIRALEEVRLLKHVKVISGTSIGAVNSFMLLNGMNAARMSKAWEEFDNKTIKGKVPFKEILNKRGLYDTDDLLKKIEPYLNAKYFKKNKVQGYATLAKKLDNKVKGQTEIEVVHLNSAPDPLRAVIASGAFPLFFVSQELNGQKYVDGGLEDNIPVDPLLKAGVDIIFSISLDLKDFPKDIIPGTMRIDFTPTKNLGVFPFVTLDFSPKKMKEFERQGYNDGRKLIKYLKFHKYIGFFKRIKFKKDTLITLNDVN